MSLIFDKVADGQLKWDKVTYQKHFDGRTYQPSRSEWSTDTGDGWSATIR